MRPAARGALELVVATLAAVAAWRVLPLPAGDPFRSTLAVLPLLVAGLRAVERLAAAAGARSRRPLGPHTGAVEGLALVALALLAVERRALGLAGTEAVLAAAFLLLLAHRLGRSVLGWTPLVAAAASRRPPGRSRGVFFLLPLVVYLGLLPWSSEHRPPDGDEPYYLLITHSLIQDGDADLADDYAAGESRRFVGRELAPQTGDPRSRDGGVYSRHNLLLPLVLAPAFAVAGRWGALVTMTILAALLAWLALRLLARLFPARPGAVLLAWAAVAFAPPLLVYSYQVWIEVPAAILVAIVAERLLVPRREGWTRRDLATVVACLALLPLLKLRLGLVAAPLAVVALARVWREGSTAPVARRPTAVAIVAALAGASALLVVHNQLRFGNPLKVHHLGELELLEKPLATFARGLFGPFYDVAFGLFFAAPLWLLVVPGLVLLLRDRRRLVAAGALLVAPYLLALAPRSEWYGGWSPPFRYLLLFLPLLAAALVPVLALRRRPAVRAVATTLVAATFVLTVFWVAIPGWTFNFADGQSLLVERVADRLGADVARFLPSYVRPRLASWLWPLASLLLVPLVLVAGGNGRSTGLPRRPGGRLAGFAVLLALLVALPVAATRLPTRVVEAEDGQAVKRGGIPHPDLWMPQRARHPSGWLLTGGSWITAPVVAGGERVTIRVTARFMARDAEPFALRLAAGDRALALWDGQEHADGWRRLEAGPLDWPAGSRLVLAAPFAGGRTGNVVAVDRVELAWAGE